MAALSRKDSEADKERKKLLQERRNREWEERGRKREEQEAKAAEEERTRGMRGGVRRDRSKEALPTRSTAAGIPALRVAVALDALTRLVSPKGSLHLQKIISRTPVPRLLGGSEAVVHGQFMGTAHRSTASIGAAGAGSSDDSLSDERLCQRLHDTITTALGSNAKDQKLINSMPFQFPTVLDAVVYITTKRSTRW
jgi:hypothetical protein